MDSLPVILDLARVLRVEPEKLIGRPWEYAPNGEPSVAGLDEIRSFLTRYDDLLGLPQEDKAPDARALRTVVAEVHRTYQAARYQEVLVTLPAMLAIADRAVRASDRSDVTEFELGYVSAYVAAAKVLTKVGATDLALLTADRAATRAIGAGSDVARGMAAYQVACALLRADRSDEAEHLAAAMAEQIEGYARSDRPTLVSVAGALWLIGAVISARQMNRDEAWVRLNRAERLAGLLGYDGNHVWTAFGPTNVALHRVAVATELGDAAEAVRVAANVDTHRLPPELASRRAQVNLDLAWAQSQRHRDAEAILHLLEAERTAPQAVRYNVLVRELIRELLTRAGRTHTVALTDLAVRAGVLD